VIVGTLWLFSMQFISTMILLFTLVTLPKGVPCSLFFKRHVLPRILRFLKLSYVVFNQCGVTCVIHAASPLATNAPLSVSRKVEMEGFKAIISACLAAGVRKLIYTESSGVLFTSSDLDAIDEMMLYLQKPADMEAMIGAEEAAKDKHGLLTAVIRPSGISR
jgi:nucleoside-diphosphate-sugar epimerase